MHRLAAAICSVLVVGSVSLAEECEASKAKASKDIVDTAASADQFSTLVTAVKKAGLVDTLKGEGPFTVLAPTNEAFAKIPKKDLDGLLNDKEKLKQVLLSHVVPGHAPSPAVFKMDSVKTVGGSTYPVVADGDNLTIGHSRVILPDVETSTGVIHGIDTVLMPN